MAPVTRSQSARQRATHLPMEIWLLIVSFIAWGDRPEAWFTLRLLCRMSKIAIEDVCSRSFLPRMGLVAIHKATAGMYCFTGLLEDGDKASFCKHGSDLKCSSQLALTTLDIEPPWHSYAYPLYARLYTYQDTFTTRIRGNPYSLSPYHLEGRSVARNGIPWRRLLSMALRSWPRKECSWTDCSTWKGMNTLIWMPDRSICSCWMDDEYGCQSTCGDWVKAARGSISPSHRAHDHWELTDWWSSISYGVIP